MKISFSWDDGAIEDLKLFKIHEKLEIPGMFFIPTYNSEGRSVLDANILRDAESSIISFGGHTQNHFYLTNISTDMVEKEIGMNKIYLEDVFAHEVNAFCYPGGKYNNEIHKIAQKYYKHIRTADIMCFRKNSSLCKPTIHFYPRGIKSLLGNGIRNRSYSEVLFLIRHCEYEYFELLKRLIEHNEDKECNIVIWGHSWEIEELDLWNELIGFMVFIKSNYSKYIVEYEELFK